MIEAVCGRGDQQTTTKVASACSTHKDVSAACRSRARDIWRRTTDTIHIPSRGIAPGFGGRPQTARTRTNERTPRADTSSCMAPSRHCHASSRAGGRPDVVAARARARPALRKLRLAGAIRLSQAARRPPPSLSDSTWPPEGAAWHGTAGSAGKSPSRAYPPSIPLVLASLY